MMFDMKLPALVAVVAMVAGCGGGGGGTTAAVVAPPSFAALSAAAQAEAAGVIDLDTGTLLVPERTTLPLGGTATYNGYVGGDLAGSALVGELSLTADFGGASMTGSATNFQHETAGAYTGTLALNGGTILPGALVADPDTFQGSLDGDLANGGTTYTTNLLLDGVFVGGTGTDVPDGVAGYADGTVGADFLTGAFVASR